MAEVTHLLWTDLETDGLYKEGKAPKLLEVGALLLPLRVFDRAQAVFEYHRVFGMSMQERAHLDPYIVEMHTKSGLLDECVRKDRNSGPWFAGLEILKLLRDHGFKRGQVALAGSGVASFDGPLLREYMPALYEFLHYASYDVGTARRAFTMLWPDTEFMPPPASAGEAKAHRAIDDVCAHLAEAQFYRDTLRLTRVNEQE